VTTSIGSPSLREIVEQLPLETAHRDRLIAGLANLSPEKRTKRCSIFCQQPKQWTQSSCRVRRRPLRWKGPVQKSRISLFSFAIVVALVVGPSDGRLGRDLSVWAKPARSALGMAFGRERRRSHRMADQLGSLLLVHRQFRRLQRDLWVRSDRGEWGAHGAERHRLRESGPRRCARCGLNN
jgi:hypothetical protein